MATDAGPCAQVGVDIMEIGGSAVDAAVATLFCNGAVHPQSSGLGVMTIYKKDTSSSDILIARERAPLAGTQDMYHGNLSLASKVNIETPEVRVVSDEM